MNSESSWPSPRRALTVYTLVFSFFIIWASARTIMNPGHHDVGIRILAFTEIAAAILFAANRSRIVGLVILLAVFTVAAVIEVHSGEWPVRFVFYAASALFVQYHSHY